MSRFLLCVVFSLLIWHLKPMGPLLQSGLALGSSRTRRDISCRDNLEYPHGNICCLNCPAGTHKISPCTRAGEKGKCEECEDGTYTEHANRLRQCFKCTQCRPDQEIVKPCTHTQDAECQCRLGGFCVPEQACEVCKKCSRCEKDEEIVRNCTSTANTECKKIQANSGSATGASVIVPFVLFATVLIGGIIVFMLIRRRRRATDSQRNLQDGLKDGQLYSDNCPTGERSRGDTRRPSCSNLNLSRQLEDEPFPKLVPVNGEESLRKCFEYFEEMDFNHHKRFFRHLGINDNVIKSKEHLLYEDKIHDLLNIWVEKEGREASLNDLLKALLDLNQRRTAEIVKEKAIFNSHYFCEC